MFDMTSSWANIHFRRVKSNRMNCHWAPHRIVCVRASICLCFNCLMWMWLCCVFYISVDHNLKSSHLFLWFYFNSVNVAFLCCVRWNSYYISQCCGYGNGGLCGWWRGEGRWGLCIVLGQLLTVHLFSAHSFIVHIVVVHWMQWKNI